MASYNLIITSRCKKDSATIKFPENLCHDAGMKAGDHISDLPYFERLNALREVLKKPERVVFISNDTDGNAEWEMVEKYGLEGVVIRDPKKRLGHGVLKLKRELTEDVFCTGEYIQLQLPYEHEP